MNASETYEKLLAEGCNRQNFAIHHSQSDAYCLAQREGKWAVFYSERGLDSAPEYESTSEEDAADFFYKCIMRQTHWHIVGFFKDEADAIALEKALQSMGIKPIRNDMPAYKHKDDPRYRVFVVGKDIFKAQALGKLPLGS